MVAVVVVVVVGRVRLMCISAYISAISAHEMGTSQVRGESLQKCFMAIFLKIRSANMFLVFIFTANWVI